MENHDLGSAIEAILFAADRPVTLERFSEVFGEEGPEEAQIKEVIEELQNKYQDESFGFEIRQAQGGYQFVTKVKNGDHVRKFLATKPFRLSRSALETLSIIAYRQPVTRAEIDKVRGIDSSHLVRTLIEKDVVKMGGKADIPGRPVQYTTTPKFLDLVGLKSVSELPPLSELKELQGDTPQDEKDPLEEGLTRFIDSDGTLEERAKELEDGLGEIETMIKSAGDPKREVYENEEERQVAEENHNAVVGFHAFARKNKPKKPAPLEMAEEAPPAEDPSSGEAQPESETASAEPNTEVAPEVAENPESLDPPSTVN